MKKINAYEVAKLAHVSPATVSRAINHRQQVNQQTLRQIDDAMEKLGFASEPTGPKTVIVNVQSLDNIFYLEVLKGLQAGARQNNLHLLIDQTVITTTNIKDYLNFIERFHPYGIIVLNQLAESVLKQLNQVCRLVQCCEHNPSADLPFVGIDDRQAAYKATNYLLTTGCQHLCFINTKDHNRYAQRRLDGFRQALQDHHVTANPAWLLALNAVDFNEALPAIEQLFTATQVPDAFVCVSDTFAAAVLKVASKYHRRVPEDIGVIGFDNTVISNTVQPTLSTVNIPCFQEGFSAIQLLTNSYQQNQQIILPTELLIRQSTK
jgi:LacI family repressor for deo operon, udp, cdd, tsx, nupC, and nupG